MIRQLKWFVGVGVLAALVHVAAITLYVEVFHLPVLLSNMIAFMTAFGVSYFGHKYGTFAHQNSSHRQAIPRFYMTALLGFVLNNTLFYVLYSILGMPYLQALVIVLGGVAILTFILSKFWAFRGQ